MRQYGQILTRTELKRQDFCTENLCRGLPFLYDRQFMPLYEKKRATLRRNTVCSRMLQKKNKEAGQWNFWWKDF